MPGDTNYEQALPNINVTRYEGNKANGFAALDENKKASIDVMPEEVEFVLINALKNTFENYQ